MVALLKLSDRFSDEDLLERRSYPRQETHLHLQGLRLDRSACLRKLPYLNLTLNDLSHGGLSATSAVSLQTGERVSLLFPSQGRLMNSRNVFGTVLRCQPADSGYQVAIEFDELSAA